MKAKNATLFTFIRIGVGAAVFVAAILSSSLVSASVTQKAGANRQVAGLITKEIEQAAADYEYDFDPSTVLFEEQAEWDFNNSVLKDSKFPTDKSRESADCHLVYYFEGAYAEGYQGDYSQTYGYLYLWEDGLYGGKINDTTVKGYWYNSSSKAPADDPATPKNESMDCLNLVSNVSKYEFINFEKASGFYDWRTHLYLGFSWGTRSMEIAGYLYYPEVAILIDTQDSMPEFRVGEEADISFWSPTRVLKNLKYSSIFVQTDVNWEATNGKITIEYVDGQKNRGISSIIVVFDEVGQQDITIKWGGFEYTYTVDVLEALPEEEE